MLVATVKLTRCSKVYIENNQDLIGFNVDAGRFGSVVVLMFSFVLVVELIWPEILRVRSKISLNSVTEGFSELYDEMLEKAKQYCPRV